MRRTLAVLVVLLLLAPELPARNTHDWENVKRLRTGTAVEILLRSGDIVRGQIEGVRDTALEIATTDRNDPSLAWERNLDRANIRKITSFRQPLLPGTKHWMLTGTAVGGVIGLTGGGISDIKNGTNYRYLKGGLAGAGLGLLVSCAAVAAVGIVDIGRGINRRKVVYES